VLRASRSRVLISVVAGVALPLAFAPFGQFWLAPLCYAALFHVWRRATPGHAFGFGFAFGVASFLPGIYWIYISVHDFGGAPAALAVFLTGGLVAIMALYSGAVGWLTARVSGIDGAAAWLGTLPALWVLAEWWRGWFLTGFGWFFAGYTQTDSWLVAYAPIGGVLTVSWAVLLLAGAIVTVAHGSPRSRLVAIAVATGVVGLAWVSGHVQWTRPQATPLTAALVQGAVPQDLKWEPEQLPRTLELYRSLTEEVHGAALIVWPEVAIPEYYRNLRPYVDEVARAAGDAGSIVLSGMQFYDVSVDRTLNAVFALGRDDPVYVKRHLVPYGEVFPVPEFVRGWLRSAGLPSRGLGRGDPEQPPVALLGERIAITICYEDVFGAEQLHSLPDATLLVNVSNDAWFGESIAADQHLQIARMRAAEAGRYLLRSTNTGISAVIRPDGGVESTLQKFEVGALQAIVRGYTGATPYARWGNHAIVLLLTSLLAVQLLITKLTMRPGT
jgi:apolipoprotein N-acyltransferase